MANSITVSPQRSPSFHASPYNSQLLSPSLNSIETLISHLIAAKRSLASIHYVQRATTILADARDTVETTTALVARTIYSRKSLTSQLKTLRRVQYELEGTGVTIGNEFSAVLADLDAADERLSACLNLLKRTKIEEGFKQGKQDVESVIDEKDTLHDFVDDRPVHDLKEALKVSIDTVQRIQQQMTRSIHTLEDDLQSVNQILNDKTAVSSSTESELRQPRIADLLKRLEDHARDMAGGLEDLVKHFDLCVTAVNHTEGAGARLQKTVRADEIMDDIPADTFEPSAEPISEEERLEMLHVIETDAAELEDVVIDIQDHYSDMDADFDKVMLWHERSELAYKDTSVALTTLEKVVSRLTGYIAEAAHLSRCWIEEKAKIEDGIAGIDQLRETYTNFLSAYDGLIVETARRRTVKKAMERIIQEAHAQLEQLYEQDLADREAFRTDKGPFLPTDIWHGLTNLPPRFGFARLEGEDAGSIPELPRKTIEEAFRRLKAEAEQIQ